MSVVSFEFLGFLAALAVVYYVLPMRVRKWALLAGSAAFWLLCGWQGTACWRSRRRWNHAPMSN